MFVYLPLQIPLLIGVAVLLLADGLWQWPPIQTETAQTLVAVVVFLITTLLAVLVDRAADPSFLPANFVMWTAFLPASVLVFGLLRVCLLILRRIHLPASRRGPLAGLIAAAAVAFAPVTTLATCCMFYGLCP